MANLGGRPSLFEPKITHRKGGKKFGGYLTKKGAQAFEAARTQLKKIAGVADASDSDVIESVTRPDAVKFPR